MSRSMVYLMQWQMKSIKVFSFTRDGSEVPFLKHILHYVELL